MFQTKSLWKSDGRDLSVSNDESVRQSGGEGLSVGVNNTDNVDLTRLLDDVVENSDSSLVISAGNDAQVSDLSSVSLENLSGLDVKLDGVSDVDSWGGESDGSGVVGNQVRDPVWSVELLHDLAKLEL